MTDSILRAVSTLDRDFEEPALQVEAGLAESAIAEILGQARKLAAKFAKNAKAVDFDGGFPAEEFKWLAEAEFLAAPLERKYGGLGLGTEVGNTLAQFLLLKEIGRGSLPVGRVYEGHLNALQLMQLFGTTTQKEAYAAEVQQGKHLFAVWNTEAADGVKVLPLSGGRYRLEGSKTFASGASGVTRPLISGALPDGSWQMMIVPMEQVKTTVNPNWWHPMGMKASGSFKVDFSGVELNESNFLGGPNDYYRQPWITGGAIRFCAVQLGGAEALLYATRTYLRKLGRLDDPYQKARLGQMRIAIETGRLWLQGAADLLEQYAEFFYHQPWTEASPKVSQAIVTYANMTRTVTERICLDVLEATERAVGARGLLEPEPFGRLIRDLRHYLRQPAPDAALAYVGEQFLKTEDSYFDEDESDFNDAGAK